MNELKPCPFCGGTRLFVGTVAEIEMQDENHEDYVFNRQHYAVVCNYNDGGCGASSGVVYKSEEGAIEAWNRRAGEHGD